MREIKGIEYTSLVFDELGAGGECHDYMVNGLLKPNGTINLVEISFQNGPIQENGVNGCQNEDLLAIVIDRLERFQKGPFPCFENQIALQRCREALGWLEARTRDR